jgi:hypothetical protein
MSALGEDVTEVLEHVPGRFQVVRHVRPKLACQRCEAITQAPAPALEDRLERRQVVRVGVDGFFNWAEDTMRRISGNDALADAIRYAVKRREALTRFCDDARLGADNNRA